MRVAPLFASVACAGASVCIPCDPHDEPLPKPGFSPTSNNGMRWPTMCVPQTPPGEEEHVFTIGDWGGYGRHARTFDNTAQKRPFIWGVDDKAQHLVADLMKKVAVVSKPKYILNVGDNFYPGGVEAHCGKVDMCSYIQTGQWKNLWEDIYDGPDLKDLEWWGCLGNHDWGGFSYGRAWDQQVAFTWHHDRWILPAMYWERRVQYCDFTIDYYFLDTNKYDAKHPSADPAHNICSAEHCQGKTCGSVGGPTSAGHCVRWFRELFDEQLQWLESRLNQSTADWQIIVTHFPPQYGAAVWLKIAKTYGVDIFITGHRHQQEVHYHDRGHGWMSLDMGGTAWTVTGGGGGVTSEAVPIWESAYTQQYGFMDLTVSKEKIDIDMWSAVSRKMRRRVTVTPIGKWEEDGTEASEATCARVGCREAYDPSLFCQCNRRCYEARDCCSDYAAVCLQRGTAGYSRSPDTAATARNQGAGLKHRMLLERKRRRHWIAHEEVNLTQEERCSAMRRRDPHPYGPPPPIALDEDEEGTMQLAGPSYSAKTERLADVPTSHTLHMPHVAGLAAVQPGQISQAMQVATIAQAAEPTGTNRTSTVDDDDDDDATVPDEYDYADEAFVSAFVEAGETALRLPVWAWAIGVSAIVIAVGIGLLEWAHRAGKSARRKFRHF